MDDIQACLLHRRYFTEHRPDLQRIGSILRILLVILAVQILLIGAVLYRV